MEGLRVLIVDDIIMNRILIKEILDELSCQVTEAKNGKEAIELLSNQTFDILLIDIEMPVMNGLETTSYIRKNMPGKVKDMPIIAITAHNPDLYFDDLHKVGFDNLVTKPYTYEQIKSLLEEYFGEFSV